MKSTAAIVAACTVALVSACGSQAGPTTKQPTTSMVVEGNRAVTYDDIGSLARASSAVIEVQPTGGVGLVPADQSGRSSLKSTITTMRVLRVIKGKLAVGVVLLRQVGDVTAASNELSSHFEKGHTYVLFVVPFRFSDGKDTGQYVLTDGSSAYTEEGSQLTSLAGDASPLPKSLTRSDLERQAS